MARIFWLAVLLLLSTRPAVADDVDLALVLVTDVSRSIDETAYALEKRAGGA